MPSLTIPDLPFPEYEAQDPPKLTFTKVVAASFNGIWGHRTNPAPIVKVVATSSPLFAGVPHARDFPPLRSGPNGGARFHLHALVIFAEPIVGPLIVGAGRYRGYGLCRPWREGV